MALNGPLAGSFVGPDHPGPKKKAFDSKREYKRWLTLRQAEQAGLISGLRCQRSFRLHAQGGVFICRYTADFVYIERGRRVVEDCKGRRTKLYNMKKRWMLAEYGIEIRES